jgi:probable rRNA maturation factor
MIKVYVKKQSNYPVSTPKIKKRLNDFFEEHGITSKADVYVLLVGEKKAKELASKYLGEKDTVHNVLSFPTSEIKTKFVFPPTDNILHLGDIIVCFNKAIEEAKEENKMIDDKVIELLEHGALHILGIHHKE